MLTNMIRKGARVRLAHPAGRPWEADVLDNMHRSNIRLCKVYGWETEMGSTYVWDWSHVKVGDVWEPVVLTDKQKRERERVRVLLGD